MSIQTMALALVHQAIASGTMTIERTPVGFRLMARPNGLGIRAQLSEIVENRASQNDR